MPPGFKCKKIKHDSEKNDLLQQCLVKIYDKPVLYFPKFFTQIIL